MKLQACNNHLLVNMRDLREENSNLVIVPDTVAQAIPAGEVFSVGPDAGPFSNGDLIVFHVAAAIGIDEADGTRVYSIPSTAVIAKYIP